ncbi:lipoyl(octanoyl) transferase LipB [Vallitalea pronyensis]|uniref:lipoyl(octanoyl) transferase LipB n=1 Tax=Vallitalea pronyensis TaxID=1348613 RepID=UPI001FE6F196|nr:lipoyl(octanoyl) transferase LipB [Vallitalea pronyensis]
MVQMIELVLLIYVINGLKVGIQVEIEIVFLEKMDYAKVLHMQEKIREDVMEERRQNTLLLVEHPPVYTIGRNGNEANILLPSEKLMEKGIDVHPIKRGGDVTYHGPGQIVGYPIVHLRNLRKGVKDYVYGLQDLFIQLLRDSYGITAHKDIGKYTGVWVHDKKITAIGIEIKRWVTMHGFAFNVNTDLNYFKHIIPCGIHDKAVTSLHALTGEKQNMEHLFKQVAAYFCEVFQVTPIYGDYKEWGMDNR